MGGIVRVSGSGLGCPDWPLCYGKLIPPMELEPWIEYIHRLSAASSGFIILLMFIACVSRFGISDRRSHLAVIATVLLVIQALLGALTVLSEINPLIALAHTGIATSLVGTLALITASVFVSHKSRLDINLLPDIHRFFRRICILGLTTFVLILSGAYVTRTDGASLACLQIPLCGISITEMMFQQWIHMTHRIIAFIVAVVMLIMVLHSVILGYKFISRFVYAMGIILSIQILLGLGNVLLKMPNELRAAHLTAGILFFSVTMVLIGVIWYAISDKYLLLDDKAHTSNHGR